MLLRLSAPEREPLLRSPLLKAAFGGTQANVAVSLCHFGVDARVVTALPDNDLGDACLGELRRHGVDTGAIRRGAGRMGLYFLTPGAMLRPSRLFYDRAGSVFAEADPGGYDWPSLLADVGWLHLSGVTLAVSAKAAQAAGAAVAAAVTRGVPVSFDCNFRASLWAGREHEAAGVLGPIAAQSTLLFAGPFDIAQLFGFHTAAQPPAEAHRLAAAHAFAACPSLRQVAGTHRQVHCTDHQTLSAYLADRDGQSASRAYEMNPVVERIGGGDAFAAGVLYGLCSALGRAQTIDFAAAATALKHASCGDFNTASVADVRFLIANGPTDVLR